MTVLSAANRNDYAGSGITGPYAYGYRIFNETDLLVTKRSATGIETTLAWPADFSVAGVRNRTGGSITLGTALAVGETLTIRRVRPLLQSVDLRNQGEYFAETHEDAFDDAVMRDQQIDNDLSSAVRLAETVDPATFDPRLPAPLVAGKALVVNGAGTGFDQAALSAAQLSAWSAAQTQKLDVFTSAHSDYTAGVTTQLTLSAAPGNIANLWITRRTSGTDIVYMTDEYSVAGSVVTFTSPIPASTTRIECRYFYTYQVNSTASENVSYAPVSGSASDVRTKLRALDAAMLSFNQSVKDAAYGAKGDDATDDTSAINACAAAINAAGGGEMYFPPGIYKVTGDLSVPRTVQIRGCGNGSTVLHATSEKKLKVTGSASNDTHVIGYLGFNGVNVSYGVTNADQGRGCSLRSVEIRNVTNGVYYGYNSYITDIVASRIHDVTNGVYFDFATAGSNAGASMNCTNTNIYSCVVGLYVNGNTADGHDIRFIGGDIEHTSGACVKTVATGEGKISISNVHLELNTGYLIENDGSNVFLHDFWALSGTETAWFHSISGMIFCGQARADFQANKFAKMNGGTIVVDPDQIFCAARFFGNGSAALVTAGSTAGTIVCGRTGYVGWAVGGVVTTLTNAAPGPYALSTIYPYDNNTRIWRFFVTSTAAVAANNILRLFLTNGSTTVRYDVVYPLALGGGWVEIVWSPSGGVFDVGATFLPTVAGNAQSFHSTVTDTGGITQTKQLTVESINGGSGTKATIVISNFTEILSGPKQTGL